MENYILRCADCKQEATPADWRCPLCQGLLRIEWTEAAPAVPVDPSRSGVWRYRPLLPTLSDDHIVTLGEGATPLIWIDRWARAHDLERVAVKLEHLNPTGSFKDRGTSLLVSHAVSLGLERLVEDSSGNAGASVAAYAARAGLPATVFVPASAPAAKRGQIARAGATIVMVDGPRSAVTDAAIAEVARSGAYYAGHNANPYFVAGMATFAYELIEAFGSALPRHLFIPTGGGSLLVGAYSGMTRWFSPIQGASAGLPHLHAIQNAGCAPIVAAFDRGLSEPPPIERRPTATGGIEVERPPRGRDILNAIRASRGSAIAVEDEAILHERRLLNELEGIDVEPTTAAAFAGLAALAKRGTIAPTESVVVAATGAGWKEPA